MTSLGGVIQAGVGSPSPIQVSRVAVRTGDLELAHELLSENYAAHRPRYRGSRERFHFSLTSTAVGTIASDALTHSVGTVAAIEPVHHLRAPEMGQYWRTVTEFVHRELADPGSAITEPLVLAQIEDTLSAAALSVFPNTVLAARASPTPIGRVGPATLRRATAYIDSHARDAITLADIVAHAGVSGRALQRSFAAHHHTTPTGYLRQVRLELPTRSCGTATPPGTAWAGSPVAGASPPRAGSPMPTVAPTAPTLTAPCAHEHATARSNPARPALPTEE